MTVTTWPAAEEYTAAIQTPRDCFRDPQLRGGRVRMHPVLGPESYSGNFALVFPLRLPSEQTCAVRCFLQPGHDRRRRYKAVSDALGRRAPSFAVGFEYAEEGIRVNGLWYPVVKMDWAKGLTFNAF